MRHCDVRISCILFCLDSPNGTTTLGLYHFNYGVALVPRALELQNDGDCGMLFTAATQINRGGPAALQDVEQAILIANLNLTAGQKAIEMSDFPSAFSFFDNGKYVLT